MPQDYSDTNVVSPWDLEKEDETGRKLVLPAGADRAREVSAQPRMRASLVSEAGDFEKRLQEAARAKVQGEKPKSRELPLSAAEQHQPPPWLADYMLQTYGVAPDSDLDRRAQSLEAEVSKRDYGSADPALESARKRSTFTYGGK